MGNVEPNWAELVYHVWTWWSENGEGQRRRERMRRWEPRGRVGSGMDWGRKAVSFSFSSIKVWPIPRFLLPKKLSSKWLRKKILFLREYNVGQNIPLPWANKEHKKQEKWPLARAASIMGKDSSEVSNTIYLKKLIGLKGGDIPFLVPASQMYVFSPLSPTVLLPCVSAVV